MCSMTLGPRERNGRSRRKLFLPRRKVNCTNLTEEGATGPCRPKWYLRNLWRISMFTGKIEDLRPRLMGLQAPGARCSRDLGGRDATGLTCGPVRGHQMWMLYNFMCDRRHVHLENACIGWLCTLIAEETNETGTQAKVLVDRR